MDDKICVAIVRKPQGIKGEIKASVLLDNPELIKKIKYLYLENGEKLTIKRVFNLGTEYGIGFEEFSTPEETLKIKNKELFAVKSEIREMVGNKDFFIQDLIGKTAIFEDGTIVGEIDDIENYGASDVVFLESKQYHNLSFANIGNIFLQIDDAKGVVVIDKNLFMQTKICDEDGEQNED